ncbi:MAG: hypothetical protein KAS98_04885 [Deltaproteobacteria bacterium]|nr:hypothetical protein [Deltaproteobacteria bacterium]
MGEAAPVNSCVPQPYRPQELKNSLYYQCVEDNFETFEPVYDELFQRERKKLTNKLHLSPTYNILCLPSAP